MNEPDVRYAEIADHSLSTGDGAGGQIDADEVAFRQPPSHGHEIAAVAATQFQYAATVYRRRLETGEDTDHRQPIRMRLGMGVARVSNQVVADESGLNHGLTEV